MVTGYDNENDLIPKVYLSLIPSDNPIELKHDSGKDSYGVWFSGDTRIAKWLTGYRYYKLKDVLYGIRYKSWPGLEHLDFKKLEEIVEKVRPKGKEINWGRLSLKSATDIVASIIEATKMLQEDFHKICFNETKENPISVGGETDIAVITPKKGFYWHTIKGKKQ